jgi:hypothetical protein
VIAIIDCVTNINRRCVVMTAFGAPLVPEVVRLRNRSTPKGGKCVTMPIGVGDENVARRGSEIETVEQVDLHGFGDHHLAVGVRDVAGQFGPASGGVDSHHGRSGDGGCTQPHGEFRCVVEQHSDVRRSTAGASVEDRPPPRGTYGDLGAPFSIRPRTILELDRHPIVVDAGAYVVGERRRHRMARATAWAE